MIALFLGTSEGKDILSRINLYTDNLYVSTATQYGGELLDKYKMKKLNTKPLNKEEIEKEFKDNYINIILDASHPYAQEISKNLFEIAQKLNIKYVRYERPSVMNNYKNKNNIICVSSYEELINIPNIIKNKSGNILNTTGTRNLDKIMGLNLENRVIHRVLPTVSSIERCISSGVKIEDIIAIKGPFSKEFNENIINQYNIKAIILKDSGIEGGTEEKLEAAIETNIYSFIIKREKKRLDNFDTIDEAVNVVLQQNIGRG